MNSPYFKEIFRERHVYESGDDMNLSLVITQFFSEKKIRHHSTATCDAEVQGNLICNIISN